MTHDPKSSSNLATDVTETLIERFRGRIKHSDVCRVHRWGDCDCDREQLQTELAQLLSALQQQRERLQGVGLSMKQIAALLDTTPASLAVTLSRASSSDPETS